MAERRIAIANLALSAARGHAFVSFDVAMNGHLISTIDAPLLSGRILWSQAAIHGFGDFCPGEKGLLEAQVDQALLGRAAPVATDRCPDHRRLH